MKNVMETSPNFPPYTIPMLNRRGSSSYKPHHNCWNTSVFTHFATLQSNADKTLLIEILEHFAVFQYWKRNKFACVWTKYDEACRS